MKVYCPTIPKKAASLTPERMSYMMEAHIGYTSDGDQRGIDPDQAIPLLHVGSYSGGQRVAMWPSARSQRLPG